jgi:dihydrofolate synthase/folylpolyglutamate synthase
MIAFILKEAGYRTGMFTSPHLSTFTERIQVNNVQISVEAVVRLIEYIRPICQQMAEDAELRHPTFFEIITAIAFKYFSEEAVDYAVLEVGMGGKLDATNVVKSQVSVITNVSLEHTEVLGDTVFEIAEKKAGIVKEDGVLVTATTDDDVYHLFKGICEDIGSKIFRVGTDIMFHKLDSNHKWQKFKLQGLFHSYEELAIPLMGNYQLLNAATAVGAVEALSFYGVKVSEDAIIKGLKNVSWPGRMEVMQTNPLVVLDGAKDVKAVSAMKEVLLKDFNYDCLIAVVSISSDKKIDEIIEEITQVVDHFVITSHRVMGRAAKPSKIAAEVERHSKTHEIVWDVRKAVNRALELARAESMVIIFGSLFLVGEAREIWYEPSNPFSHLEY